MRGWGSLGAFSVEVCGKVVLESSNIACGREGVADDELVECEKAPFYVADGCGPEPAGACRRDAARTRAVPPW